MPNAINATTQAQARALVDPLTPLVMQRIYESGAWVPALQGSTTAGTFTYNYATTNGRFVRVGAKVTATARIVVTGISAAAAGELRVTGLPYQVGSGGIRGGAVAGFDSFDMDAGWLGLSILPVAGTSYAVITATVDNGARATATADNLTASTVLDIWVEYEAEDRASLRETILSLGPIAYYILNETGGTTAADSSGNAYNAAYSASGVTYGVNLPPFVAPQFAASGLVSSPGAGLASAFDGDEGSIVLFCRDLPTLTGRTLIEATDGTGNSLIAIRTIFTSRRVSLDRETTTSGIVRLTTGILPASEWTMIGLSWSLSGTTMEAFVNGVSIATAAISGTWGTLDTAAFGIGADLPGASLAHVALFDTARDAADMLAIWDAYQGEL